MSLTKITRWAIQIEPGKPFTHRLDKAQGKLHISKANLFYVSPTLEESVVQFHVGDAESSTSTPVHLCTLVPYEKDLCPLDLEFGDQEEDHDVVVFLVLGPNVVRLSGVYLGNAPSDENDVIGKKKVRDDAIIQDADQAEKRVPEQPKDAVPSTEVAHENIGRPKNKEKKQPNDKKGLSVSRKASKNDRAGKKRAKEKLVEDPNKPKWPASAFFSFMKEFRKRFKEKHPDNRSVSVVGKAGGDKWKSMSASEKSVYAAMAEKRKADYNQRMAYMTNQKEAIVKDPNKPKCPASGLFSFMKEFRKTFKEKHPNNRSVSVVSKAGGDMWKSMSDSEKAVYAAKAEKRKADYYLRMAYVTNLAERKR